MTTKRENQLAVAGTIEKRVKASESLLERMGITPEAYERVVLNALIRNPDLAGLRPGQPGHCRCGLHSGRDCCRTGNSAPSCRSSPGTGR